VPEQNASVFRIAPQLAASKRQVRKVLLDQDFVATVSGPRTAPPIEFAATISQGGGGIVEAGVVEAGVLDQHYYSSVPVFSGFVDTSIVGSVLPRADGRQQIIGRPMIYVNDVEIPSQKLMGEFQLTERIDGARSFSFQMPARADIETDTAGAQSTAYTNPFGENWLGDWLGAPPGKQEIDIYWVVPAGTTYFKIPVVTEGIVENASLQHADTGDFWQINGVGKEQRLDRQKTSMKLPPGHGLSLGEMIKRIVGSLEGIEEAEVPVFVPRDDCPIAPHRYKEVILKDDEGWRVANQILSLFNYRLRVTREGDLTIQYMGRGQTEAQFKGAFEDAFDWKLTASDLLADPGIAFEPANDGPTAVRISGSEQTVQDDENSGITYEYTTILTEGDYARARPPQKIQNVAGDLTTTGFTESSIFQPISKTTIVRRLVFGALTSEELFVEGWYNPEVKAGTLQNDGTTDWITGVYIRDGRGVQFSEEQWMDLHEERTVYWFPPRTNDDGEIIKPLVQVWSGAWEPYNPRAAVANILSAGTLDWINSTRQTWQGEGIIFDSEISGTRLKSDTRNIWSNNGGFIDSEITYKNRVFAAPGNSKYYATGKTSNDGNEIEQSYEDVTIQYQGGESSSHTKITTVRAYHGDGRSVTVTTETGEGYKPAVPLLDISIPDEELYPDGKVAARGQAQEFEVVFRSEALEEHRQAYEEQYSSPYLEDENEALCWGRHIVAEGSAVPITFEMPINPLMQPGQRVRLDAGRRKDSLLSVYDVRLEETQLIHNFDTGEGRTSVQGKMFVI
jgi:hypothetical protein